MVENKFKDMESKWQKEWESKKAFLAIKNDTEKFYCLEMFPYPSATGLHMGHALNYTIGDIYARFKRLKGFNVLYPMGYDAFGLPAENAAIKANEHPATYTESSMKNFIEQQKALGLSYDWDKTLATCRPEYYRWNQFFFIKLFEKGLVYRKKSAVNWCKECNTVLANEQVHSGKCWRHDATEVELKQLEQWFIKTTTYSDELLEEVKKLDWPERIKIMQDNWIGKSEGTEVQFGIETETKTVNSWPIFTTRVDTIFSVTFMVIAAQHPRLYEFVSSSQKHEVDSFVKKIKSVSEKDQDAFSKEGVFTGSYAINPFNNEKVPIWAGNFVLADYGSGMVMADAHDKRDVEFAKKYDIPLKTVLEPITGTPHADEEKRESIVAIVENLATGKILSINWGHLGGNIFVGGGLDKGEDPLSCAIREIREETGYQNVQLSSSTEKIHHHYFAASKNVYRNITAIGMHFTLVNEERLEPKLEENEKGKFKVEWLTKIEAKARVKDELHKYAFEKFFENKIYTDYGILYNSAEFSGLTSQEAIPKMQEWLEKKGLGKKVFNYKFRDWLVSRQRYWGTPIPFVYCFECGVVPEKQENLPVLLPTDVTFGDGNPIKSSQAFVNTSCPKCGKPAKRETDTMDTFFDSSWYFLRYFDNKNSDIPFNKEKSDYWMPVDMYIGGAEHACMHLIYARFFTKALRDMGMLSCDEPFPKLFNQGMLHGADGNKMSKSLGNVINPLDIIDKYSADSLRFFLMSLASPDSDSVWTDSGMESAFKYLLKMYTALSNKHLTVSSKRVKNKINKCILEVTYDIENFKYNLAIIKLRDAFDYIEHEEIEKVELEKFLKILHPFCPHMTEEIWHKIGNKDLISLATWPEAEESAIDEKIDAADLILRTTMLDIHAVKNLLKLTMINKITLIISPTWKYDLYELIKAELQTTRNSGEILKTIMGSELKKYGQDITRIVPSIVKDPSKIPELILSQKEELLALHDAKEKISETFDADIVIVLAEESTDAKAKNASPGKPAIVLS